MTSDKAIIPNDRLIILMRPPAAPYRHPVKNHAIFTNRCPFVDDDTQPTMRKLNTFADAHATGNIASV